MKRLIVLLLALLSVCGMASAQMTHTLPVLKGSDNPANISDAAAYHLVLAHFSNVLGDPSTTESHAGGLLRLTGLSPDDQQQFVAVVGSFRTQFEANIATHNQNASIGLAEDFSVSEDSLVSSARAQLTQNLSPDGLAKFDAFVQNEKRHMQVSAPSGGSLPMLDASTGLSTTCTFSPQYQGYATFADGNESGMIFSGRSNNVVTITAYRGSFTVGETLNVAQSNNGGTVQINGAYTLTSVVDGQTLIRYPQGHIPAYQIVPSSTLTYNQVGPNFATASDNGIVAVQGSTMPLVVDATLTGTTTGIAACMNNALHTPQTRIGNPGNQQVINGTPVSPLSYINMTSTRTYDIAPGQEEQMSVQENVTCTVVGEFNNFIATPVIEFAKTREASLGVRSNCVTLPVTKIVLCDIDSKYWCTPGTSPPDAHFSPTLWQVSPIPAPSFWTSYGLCERASGTHDPWTCSYGFAVGLPAPQGFEFCTHNP